VQPICVDNCTDKLSIWYGEDMGNRLRPPKVKRASALARNSELLLASSSAGYANTGGGDLTPSQVSVILV